MAATISALDGYFKEAYGEVEKVVPSFAHVQRDIEFRTAERVGDSYHFPVFLRRSHGVTFAGGATAGTAFSLNSPESLVSKDANLTGTEFVLQEDIAYGVLSRAEQRGPQAFGDAMDEVVLGMKESADCYKEMALLYGGVDIGQILARTNDSGTTQTFSITEASWAPGLWAQMEGAYITIFQADLSTGIAGHSTNTVQVSAINLSEGTRTVTLVGNETELDAVATYISTSAPRIVPRSANGNWFSGMDKIITNSGSLFGISAATYSLWAGNSYSAGSGKLTMGKVQAAISTAAVRGLLMDAKAYVSTYAWTDLNNDLSALRRYADDTKSEMTNGTTSIKFYGANGGVIEVISHPMVKAGEAFIICPKHWKRIGSTDTTFRIRGANGMGENFYQELESSAGIRLRAYWDQALICGHPAKQVKITNIVNESL